MNKTLKNFEDPKILKKLIQQKIHKQSEASFIKHSEIIKIKNAGLRTLNKYLKKDKALNLIYNDIKKENQDFKDCYKPILEQRDTQTFLEDKFRDDLILYKNRGYEIPNLTTKANAIKYTPLTLKSQKDIDRFYSVDLHELNEIFKKNYNYNKITKLLQSEKTKINLGNCEDDEAEGINSKLFLDKCDELIKSYFKDRKKKKKYLSASLNNWFKKDLFQNRYLFSKKKKDIYEENELSDCSLSNKESKEISVNKEINQLKKENTNLKKLISDLEYEKHLSDSKSRRISMLGMHNRLLSNNLSYNFPFNSDFKVTYSHSNLNNNNNYFNKRSSNYPFNMIKKNILNTSPNKKKQISPKKNIGSGYLITSLRSEVEKHKINKNNNIKFNKLGKNNLRKSLEQLRKKKLNKEIKKNNNNFDISLHKLSSKKNLDISYDKEKFETEFSSYRKKDASCLFEFINDTKKKFRKLDVLSLYKWSYGKKLYSKYKIYDSLDKNLYKGLLKIETSE